MLIWLGKVLCGQKPLGTQTYLVLRRGLGTGIRKKSRSRTGNRTFKTIALE